MELDSGMFELERNAKWKESFSDRTLDYIESAAGGDYNVMKLGAKLSNLLSHVSGSLELEKASNLFKGCWTMTCVPRVPAAVVSLTHSVEEALSAVPFPSVSFRSGVAWVREVATNVATLGYATSPFLCVVAKTSSVGVAIFEATNAISCIADTCTFGESVESGLKAQSFAQKVHKIPVSSEVKIAIDETKTLCFLKTLKATCSIAAFVMGLSYVAGRLSSKIPGYTLLGLVVSLASSVLGIGADLYRRGMKHEPINFFADKHVQHKAA